MANRYPYNAMTTKKFREMGRYYEKTEYLNPFHIIKERGDLRDFRDMIRKFCDVGLESENLEQIKEWINILKGRALNTINNTYFAGEKKDAFGFMDYLCIDANEGAVAVQVTSASGHAEHRKKILRNDNAARWVNFHKVELWSWQKKLKKKDGKLKVWTPRIEVITLDMFVEFAKGAIA